MKFRIIEERLYNEFGDHFRTLYRVKEQRSILGITYWMYLVNKYDGMSGSNTVKWAEEKLEVVEEILDDYIEGQMVIRKTTSVKIEREIVKEITK